MGKYRKIPVIIEAFRLGHESIPDWFMDKVTKNEILLHSGTDESMIFCTIETLEGVMQGDYGDWIIKGVADEIYPCKHDVFVLTYTHVEE